MQKAVFFFHAKSQAFKDPWPLSLQLFAEMSLVSMQADEFSCRSTPLKSLSQALFTLFKAFFRPFLDAFHLSFICFSMVSDSMWAGFP